MHSTITSTVCFAWEGYRKLKKNVIKIILDVVMLVLLTLMYRVTVFGFNFHEIGGLAACGLFIIHYGVNWRWTAGVTRRLVSPSLPLKTLLGYAVDALLLVCVIVIALSGIMISRALFPEIGGNLLFWTLAHYFSAAVALLLCGVHIGLHWSFVKSMFARVVRLPRAVARPLGIVLVAAAIIYGGYNTMSSRFTGWLSAPFQVLSSSSSIVYKSLEQESGSGQGLGQQHRSNSSQFEEAVGLVVTYGSITAVPAFLTVVIESALKSGENPRRPRGRPGQPEPINSVLAMPRIRIR